MIIEIILSVVVIGLLFSLYNQRKLNRFKVFNKKINFLSNIIQKGALKFLHIEYKIISIFVFIITLVLLFLDYKTAISFFIGAILSALIAYIGLNMSTSANGKTVVAAKKGLN
jgi:K(+)-stimulated pyrophosphate-energized sodium pump